MSKGALDPNFRHYYTYHRVRRYFAVRRHWSSLCFSPDDRELIYVSDRSGQFNVWAQALIGGSPRQVTNFGDHAFMNAACTPNGDSLLLQMDQHGNQRFQLQLLTLAGGTLQPLRTDAENQYRITHTPYSPGGRFLAFTSNRRSKFSQDVIIVDQITNTQHLCVEGGFLFPMSWSHDGNYLTVSSQYANDDLGILLVDLKRAVVRTLTHHEEPVYFMPGPWRPDHKGFYLTTDYDHEFTYVGFFHLDSGYVEPIAKFDWDVDTVITDASGKQLLYTVNEAGYSKLFLQQERNRQARHLSSLPEGVITAPVFSHDGKHVAFFFDRPTHPPELYCLEIETGQFTQLSKHADNERFGVSRSSPKLISIPSMDCDVPAWLYQPERSPGDRPAGCVMFIHGGPEAQARATYYPLFQYLVGRGIGVLVLNIRGSTGYGKTYQFGISYGGFVTLSAISRLSVPWAAAVDMMGPSNLETFLATVPPTWSPSMQRLVGDLERDRKELRLRSPIHYLDRIQTPLLVIQGKNDPQVVRAESDHLVTLLQNRSAHVEHLVFDDEGHSFNQRSNWILAYQTAATFLEGRLV